MSKPSGAIDMTQGKPINLMLRFALPMMIGSIFQSLYSMVDSAVLGRFVGSHALAAIRCHHVHNGPHPAACNRRDECHFHRAFAIRRRKRHRPRAQGHRRLRVDHPFARRCSGSHQRFRRAAAHAAFKNAGRRHRHVRFIHSDCLRLRHRTVCV